MKRLLILSAAISLWLMAPTAKAQGGACVALNNSSAGCSCNGRFVTVTIKICSTLHDLNRCNDTCDLVTCCSTAPTVRFVSACQDASCNGPKLPVALKGVPDCQQLYLRNCRGQYVASRNIGSRAQSGGD